MSRQPSATTNFGRRFWVLAALSLGPAVATSFARFAYALILPAMRAELDLSYSQAGSLNTSNALGYLVGALLCTHYVSRLGNRRLFSFGLVVTVLALLGAGLAETFIGQMALRGVAGISSAMVYISGAVLVSNLYPDRPEVSKSAIAIYFGGAGAGIVMSGVGIPWLLATLGDVAWRSAWLAIGGISGAFAIASICSTGFTVGTSDRVRRFRCLRSIDSSPVLLRGQVAMRSGATSLSHDRISAGFAGGVLPVSC